MCCKFEIYTDCFLTPPSERVDWDSGVTFSTVRITTAVRPSGRKAGNDWYALRFFAKESLAKKEQVTSVCPHAC